MRYCTNGVKSIQATSSDNEFIGNKIIGSTTYGMQLQDCDRTIVRNNTIRNNGANAIISDFDYGEIVDNICDCADTGAVVVVKGDHNKVCGNTIADTSAQSMDIL